LIENKKRTEGDYKIPLNPIKLKNKFYGTTAKRGRQAEGVKREK